MIGPKIMPYQGAEEPSHQPYIMTLLHVGGSPNGIKLNPDRFISFDLNQAWHAIWGIDAKKPETGSDPV